LENKYDDMMMTMILANVVSVHTALCFHAGQIKTSSAMCEKPVQQCGATL